MLTGFIGERTNRRVALVTADFRLYHRLAPFFEAHGITILGLAPGDDVPASVRVLLDGPDGDPRSVAVREDDVATWLATIAALDPRREGTYNRIVFGIDPGETIGLAVLADGAVMWYEETFEPARAIERLGTWAAALQAKRWEVHIGDGAPAIGEALKQGCMSHLSQMRIAMVPEAASSPTAPQTTSRHTDAAILIAMREAP